MARPRMIPLRTRPFSDRGWSRSLYLVHAASSLFSRCSRYVGPAYRPASERSLAGTRSWVARTKSSRSRFRRASLWEFITHLSIYLVVFVPVVSPGSRLVNSQVLILPLLLPTPGAHSCPRDHAWHSQGQSMNLSVSSSSPMPSQFLCLPALHSGFRICIAYILCRFGPVMQILTVAKSQWCTADLAGDPCYVLVLKRHG